MWQSSCDHERNEPRIGFNIKDTEQKYGKNPDSWHVFDPLS